MTKAEAKKKSLCLECMAWGRKKQRCFAMNGTDECPRHKEKDKQEVV
ncbi:MAG: hypothetical protein JW724_03195 [Candidatus Altiarchaeota archaeon]|nr:hypothetical protein [Candidatus Altiarchaeota archaeon]